MNGIILISAYNSAATLSNVLDELKDHNYLNVVLIDDGSDDNTAEIARSYGVHVIQHEKNYGKGAALQTGFHYASGQEIDFVITLDADEQHPVQFIPDFLALHQKHPDAVLLGTRQRNKNMPWIRKFSNSISAFLISKRAKQNIYDAQCGFRLIPKRYLSWHFSSLRGFIFELEVLIALAKNAVDFKFVPIPTIYSKNQSKMTYFDSTFKFIFMYIASFFKSYKQRNHDS